MKSKEVTTTRIVVDREKLMKALAHAQLIGRNRRSASDDELADAIAGLTESFEIVSEKTYEDGSTA